MQDFAVVSLNPIAKGDWVFKVSANNYEQGVLVFASNNSFGYHRCRYFQNHNDARTWISSLGFITKEQLDDNEK